MKYYKVLNDKQSCNGGDMVWTPNKWMPAIKGGLIPCENGYHVCREQDILHWAGPNLWHCEVGDEIIGQNDKCVVREARITTKVEGWNEKNLRLFAADCAEHVLDIYIKNGGDNETALMLAIHVAREFAHGRASMHDMDAAGAAAWTAAGTAAWDAARVVAWEAAATAAWAAAGTAARTAAWAATAGDTAGATEREWQLNRLKEYVTL